MSIPLTDVTILGGPLPEGNLCAYSYDPITSTVYLARLLDESYSLVNASYFSSTETNKYIEFTGTLYEGIIKLDYASDINNSIGTIIITNDMGIVLTNTILVSNDTFDTTLLGKNTFSMSIVDTGIYTIRITSTPSNALQLLNLALPTGVSVVTNCNGLFNQIAGFINTSVLLQHSITISDYKPINTSWGYARKNGKHLALQTIAPFPPAYYDTDWYDLINYTDIGNFTHNYVTMPAYVYLNSETHSSTPDLSTVVKLVMDTHADNKPSCYSIALITQETADRELFWRCIKEQRVYKPETTEYVINICTWHSSENAYKYKSGGVYFGGKNYSGPLNTVLVDNGSGSLGTEHAILDLNEFKVNASNETFVYDYISNYNQTTAKVYCVLDKLTGRMAEIDVNSRTVKYFTLVVPLDYEIQKLYYTTRLMYTVKKSDNTELSLYDANNNGILLYTFDLGTYNPSIIPQFSIIN